MAFIVKADYLKYTFTVVLVELKLIDSIYTLKIKKYIIIINSAHMYM